MAFLFLFFTVALSLCVVGLIVIALAAILGSVRDNRKLKKLERQPRLLLIGNHYRGFRSSSGTIAIFAAIRLASSRGF